MDSSRPDIAFAEPAGVDFSPSDYQPTKAELEQEFDMLGADMETLRRVFFRPFRPERRQAEKDGTSRKPVWNRQAGEENLPDFSP